MNIKQEVFSKITELSKEQDNRRVELALVDDFNKSYQKLNDVFFKAETNVVDYNELAVKIINDFNTAGQVLLAANKSFEDITKASKDLGIELPAQVKNQGEALKLFAKDIDFYINKLKSNKISLQNG